MKAKSITVLVLLVFVAASVGYLVFKETDGGDRADTAGETAVPSTADKAAGEAPTAARGSDSPPRAADHRVIAYYFHTTKRCVTCRKMEAYTAESIRANFVRQLKAGTLEFHIINVDESPNGHFIDDYRLTTKSVVLADYRDGEQVRWKNLGRIWSLVGDKQSFMNYIRDETNDYLGELAYD